MVPRNRMAMMLAAALAMSASPAALEADELLRADRPRRRLREAFNPLPPQRIPEKNRVILVGNHASENLSAAQAKRARKALKMKEPNDG